MGKLDYLARSVVRQFDASRLLCPNCGASRSTPVDAKMFVTQLRRCEACMLMFRTPTDDPSEAAHFYNHNYAQGFTTDLPSPERLAELKALNFSGTEKDYSYYIDVVSQLGGAPGERLFDFGCSWGYGSYQFRRAGFETISYEISKPRRQYGIDNLGIDAIEDFESWALRADSENSCDIFFSAHVLEHVPSPSRVMGLARRILKPGGLFVAFVPNGSSAFRDVSPSWSKLWGEVHPNFLDDIFFGAALKGFPIVFCTSPARIDVKVQQELRSAVPGEFRLDALEGSELLCAARFH